jgi:CRP-like cAMP-binding protein
MISKEDLIGINCLKNLTDEMLYKILPDIEKYQFQQNDIIFTQNDTADTFYMLKRGRILLERRISDRLTISVESIKSGYSFGWSGIIAEGNNYTLEAICSEPCEVLAINQNSLIQIMESDNALGYLLMREMVYILKHRLNSRTTKLTRAIKNHPDLKALL